MQIFATQSHVALGFSYSGQNGINGMFLLCTAVPTCHLAKPWLVATRPTYHLAIVTHPPLNTMCSHFGTCVWLFGDVPVSRSPSHTLTEQILLNDTHVLLAKDTFDICDVHRRWEPRKLRLGHDSRHMKEAAISFWFSLDRQFSNLESSRQFGLALGSVLTL